MNLVELDRALRQLRLSGMADVLDTRLHQAQTEQMAPIDLVTALVADELQRRQDRLLARRHKQARFRDADRALDSFDFTFNKKMAISGFPKWRKCLVSLSFRRKLSVRSAQIGTFGVNRIVARLDSSPRTRRSSSTSRMAPLRESHLVAYGRALWKLTPPWTHRTRPPWLGKRCAFPTSFHRAFPHQNHPQKTRNSPKNGLGNPDRPKKMNRSLVYELATARFIGQREDALFLGPPGTGKSHLAQAIGRAAIQQGYRVLYREAHTLLEELAEATLADTRKAYLAELTVVPLLIVDDLGMRKLPHTAAEDLLELIMRRYERASTLLTSNRPVDDWGKLLGDTAAVTALLDRLLHHAHILKCGPRSWRTKLHTDLRSRAGLR